MGLQAALILLLSTGAFSLDQDEARQLKAPITPRLIGGQAAFPSQYPFMAAITVQTPTSRFFCSGTLISNQWILTAGHCVIGATLFIIQLGSNSLTAEDPNRVTLATSTYEVHEDFKPDTLENDIGLIKLRLPISFTDYIRVTDYLPASDLIDDQTVVAIGWGQVSDHDPNLSDTLNWVLLAAISNDECRLSYGSQILSSMVCVSGNYNEGPCIGDSGSPLLQVLTDSRMVHLGISSFVSSNGCESTEPAGYTRTYPFVDWIRNHTGIET